MKKLLIILLIPFLSYSQIPSDKQDHFVAGAAISTLTYIVVAETTKNKKKAFWYSLGVSTLAGLTKELIDENKYKGFDSKDLLATSLGGFTVSITFQIILIKKQKAFNYGNKK